MEVSTRTKLTCPECGFVQEVEMPTDVCQFFYQCVNCKFTLRSKAGDCCVFCSYREIPCPPKQMAQADQMPTPHWAMQHEEVDDEFNNRKKG